MKRIISKYTMSEDRSIVYEGVFESGEDVEINEGDYILVFHTCKFCNANIMQKVERKQIAYYFNNKPVFEYKVIDGGVYKCDTKHVSKYDQIVSLCEMKQQTLKTKTMKEQYFKQVGKLYIQLSDMCISCESFNSQVKAISKESGISEQELRDQGYYYSFKTKTI